MNASWIDLEAWQRGDSSAGERVIEACYPQLARFFRNKAPIQTDVVDLVNQTLLGLVEAKGRVRGDRAFPPYLFGVARLTLYSYLRKRDKRAREATDFSTVCVCELDGASPSSVIGGRHRVNVLLDCLRRLSVRDQLALELKFIEGLADSELAEALGVPRGSVHRLVTAATARLRELVRGEMALATLEPERMGTHSLQRWAATLRHELAATPSPPDSTAAR